MLASSSRYRAALLAQLRLPFRGERPDIDEHPLDNEEPGALALRLAREKAAVVAARNPGALVIGSDQVAVHEGRLLGKPLDEARACAQLMSMSGGSALFLTALCLLDTRDGREWTDCVQCEVGFRNLSRQQVETYIREERPLDCCGSFRIEGLGVALFRWQRSEDPSALVGLPLMRLTSMLAEAGVDVLGPEIQRSPAPASPM